MSLEPLLSFIRKVESGDNYNAIWGGIRSVDYPSRPLTDISLKDVLAWQNYIDPHYMSEAAGAYQIMEDTLRGIYRQSGVPLEAKFNKENQDKLAVTLLRIRGLDDYLSFSISLEAFANSLAKEWAALPVVSGPKKGKSYYDGDGINSTKVKVEDFKRAIQAINSKPTPTPQPTLLSRFKKWFKNLK